ncbi:hypothetical protein [Bacillus massilinigeriensis]|uniref:hypothetical protein n=1 Tax=Bacillus mediterraneensis TaxID=1805474 RepID=UPI0008F8D1D6|nr:hypothetical protein [Bacillus mediterraneensis]
MNLFLFKPYENHNQHTIVDIDGVAAEQLKASGQAVEVSLGEYDQHHQRAKAAFNKFKKAEEAIKNSDNPYLKIPEVRDYELKKIREEFEAESLAAEADWKEFRKQAIESAKTKAAQAYIPVSERDRATAEQAVGRYAMQIAQAVGADAIREVIGNMQAELSRLTDSQKIAMQSQIGRVTADLERKIEAALWTERNPKPRLSGIYSELQDIRNMDLLGVKAAESLPNTVAVDYNTVRVVRKW